MEQLKKYGGDAKLLSPLNLAYVGDAVYDLLVREYLISQANRPVGELNKHKVELVNCSAQSRHINLLLPRLTENETDIYKRGRNACPHSTPKNGSVADYHNATGLEALFGYLYLNNEIDRLRELFDLIISFT